MSQKKPVLSRRNFLLSAGAGGAAAAAALVVTKSAPSELADAKDKRATSGYKVSAHIENYYRTTKNI
jgi:nitrous oxide reductase